MKKIIPAILLFACTAKSGDGLSDTERRTLELQIDFIKRKAVMRYKNDSIGNDSKNFARYYGTKNMDTLMKLSARVFADRWNDPYEITKDSTLSLTEYLKWCKANGYDPVTKIDYLK